MSERSEPIFCIFASYIYEWFLEILTFCWSILLICKFIFAKEKLLRETLHHYAKAAILPDRTKESLSPKHWVDFMYQLQPYIVLNSEAATSVYSYILCYTVISNVPSSWKANNHNQYWKGNCYRKNWKVVHWN